MSQQDMTRVTARFIQNLSEDGARAIPAVACLLEDLVFEGLDRVPASKEAARLAQAFERLSKKQGNESGSLAKVLKDLKQEVPFHESVVERIDMVSAAIGGTDSVAPELKKAVVDLIDRNQDRLKGAMDDVETLARRLEVTAGAIHSNPHEVPPTEDPESITRLSLVNGLLRLDEAQFSRVVEAVEDAKKHVPQGQDHEVRVFDLLRWAETKDGPSPAEIYQTAMAVAPDFK